MFQWLKAISRRAMSYAGIPLRDPALASYYSQLSQSAAGVSVTDDRAMSYSPLYAGVRLIAETVASLPLHVYKRSAADGRERDDSHPLTPLLRDEPNEEMTAFSFVEKLQRDALRGNAYAEIERSKGGVVLGLWPITASRVEPFRDKDSPVRYRIRLPDGGETILQRHQILHISGPSADGICGDNLVEKARESIGLGLATEQYGASFFGSGALPGMVLEYPGELGKTARENLRRSWNEMHQGLDRSHRVAILEEGMKATPVGVSPEDAQANETRLFQVQEMSRWLNVPPHFLRDLSRATFSNIEVQGYEFLQYTLRPWLVRWESELRRKLLRPEERATHFIEFNVDALLRASLVTRYQAYSIGRNGGWLSRNDIRRMENLTPIAGGNDYLMPKNMDTVGNQTGEGNDEQGTEILDSGKAAT